MDSLSGSQQNPAQQNAIMSQLHLAMKEEVGLMGHAQITLFSEMAR